MNENILQEVIKDMLPFLNNYQLIKLKKSLKTNLKYNKDNELEKINNDVYLIKYFSAKSTEGCSEKSLSYYKKTICNMIHEVENNVTKITTDDLRKYLTEYQILHNSSKVTIDNIRRILSSFFNWLEDEDYIIKSPVRRIHKIRTTTVVKETYTDEELEKLRDNCSNIRDLSIVDLLSSTGMRIGELVRLNKNDINFNERECLVLGKGNKERITYFDARIKLHLKKYLTTRIDYDDSLFVSIKKPNTRLTIGGIEARLKYLGKLSGIKKVYPHKFRRTLATIAIDKGMPIEQLQKLLGHKRIDTTLHYAMVKQNNVKMAHRKFIG